MRQSTGASGGRNKVHFVGYIGVAISTDLTQLRIHRVGITATAEDSVTSQQAPE
jgi:hypothetical protein